MTNKIDNRGEVTRILDRIRREVGGEEPNPPFVPRPFPEPINRDLKWKEIKDGLQHPDGWLTYKGQPVFVYIRDHTGFASVYSDPLNLNRVHFTFCTTLIKMEKEGRFESRYRATNRADNKYLIDIADGWGHKSKEVSVPLYPCRNCLSQSGYRCFSGNRPEKKQRIVETFDAKEAIDFIKQHLDSRRLQDRASGLRPDTAPAGYARNQSAVSLAYRKEKGFTCEKCGVNLRDKPRLIDAHHKDSDKRNNTYDNLQCLCKLCHAEEHNHYHVSDSDRMEIGWARERQQFQL